MAVMDTALYDYELFYGMKPDMDKRTRLEYNASLMTHVRSGACFAKRAQWVRLVPSGWCRPRGVS